MKKSFFKRAVSGALSTAVASMFFLISAGSIPVDAASGDRFTVGNGTNQYKGTSEGYSYEVWLDNTGGSGSMTLGKGAAFKAEWSASVPQGNFLARRGLDFGSEKKATDYDYIGLDYDATYSQTGSGGNSRLCVYGWFENRNAAGNPPLVEYYIIEDWVNWRPTANGASKTVTIDGGDYEIFAIDHTGPTIHGNTETFKQYFSVRKDTRTSGHITVSEHFKAWADQGWGIGNLYEVALNAEGWESSGVADVAMLDVYTTKKGDNTQPTTTPSNPVEPDANGMYFNSTFESGKDDWSPRGDASVSLDSKNFYDGKNSLFVSGRTDNWNGTAYALDSSAFVPGNAYSFGTAVLQKSGETVDMKLTLQYTLNGEENYDEIASATAKSGEWTKLENTSFTIPAGAKNALIYVEAPDSLTDFYIDNAFGAKEGTKSTVVNGGGTVEGSTPATTNPTTPITTNPTTPITTNPTTPITTNPTAPSSGSNIIVGDANCDDTVNIADATAIIQHIGNQDEYELTEQGIINAEYCDGVANLTGMDAVEIQRLVAHMIDSFPAPPAEVTTTPPAPPASKNYLENSFETGADKWDSRGSASIKLDTNNYYSGKSSLFVSGRTDNWNGAAVALSPDDFTAGNSYSFSAAVMQKSGSTTSMQITLQYTLNGETCYDPIASADVKSGEWTKLENTSFTIPDGASDMLIYIEAPDSLTDFYIDDVLAATEGTKSSVVTGNGTVDTSAPVIPPVQAGGVDISWIDPTKPMVAISFDDGASPATGTRIVKAIADSGFHATFFYVGDWIRGADGENEVQYAFSKGMEIANHTTSHPNLTEKSSAEIRNEYDACASKLKGIIGTEPSKLLRLPYLASDDTVKQTLNDVPMITCAIDTADWNGASKDDIINKIVSAKNNGSLNGAIVLAHETYDTTAAAMEYIAPYLKDEGWQIVSISEMFAVKNQQLNGGQIYTKAN